MYQIITEFKFFTGFHPEVIRFSNPSVGKDLLGICKSTECQREFVASSRSCPGSVSQVLNKRIAQADGKNKACEASSSRGRQPQEAHILQALVHYQYYNHA